jgi:Zn finger protein HypA/HybF involved in hydrogenase expression
MVTHDIKVKCRQCGKSASAESFILDHVYKKMVCPQCVRDRNSKENKVKSGSDIGIKVEPKSIPSDWDDDDRLMNQEYLKKSSKPNFIGIKEKVNVKCNRCSYAFKYDPIKKYPNLCPGCGMRINL